MVFIGFVSFLLSALSGGPVPESSCFTGVELLFEWGVLFLLPMDTQGIFGDVGLFYGVGYSRSDAALVFFTCHCTLETDWCDTGEAHMKEEYRDSVDTNES